MEWIPNQPIPLDILDILIDDVEEFSDEDGEVEEDGEVLEIPNMPLLFQEEDGSVHPFPEPAAVYSSSDEDEEWKPADELIQAAISPLTSPNRSPIRPEPQISDISGTSDAADTMTRFRIEVLNTGTSANTRGRGRGSTRGRGRGRGFGRLRNVRNWLRGDLLEEVYVTDESLPPDLREQIQRHLNARTVNERRSVDEEVEDEMYGFNEGFEWRDMNGWSPVREHFLPDSTGPTQLFDNAYDAMHAIWTDDIMAEIVQESNRYAQSKLVPNRPRFARDWYESNIDEMWILFAFWIMLGIIRMPSIKSCFTSISILKTDVFRHLLTESRYWNLNASFNLSKDPNPNDPLSPMGSLLDHLNAKFQELYHLQQEVCINESLTLWNGPGGFKHYIKTKSARFGIKSFQLCESATGYLWSFFVHVGRVTSSDMLPPSVSTVLRLIRPILNRGHTLFMDNWFNSPNLARWLKRNKTDCVGTLRTCRKNVPELIKHCPLKEGQFVARASDDVMVVAVHDRQRVTCLSTYHDVSQVYKEGRRGQSSQHKFKLIDDYNQAMGSVDRLDQMLEAYLVERKQCLKWNKKIFKRLLNISIQNSRILVERSTNTRVDSLAFRLALVQEIIKRHLPNVPRQQRPERSFKNVAFPLNRLTERHFIQRIPITEEMRQHIKHRQNLGRRVCVWCSHKGRNRQKTIYECAECNLPLCMDTCFKEFHTIP